MRLFLNYANTDLQVAQVDVTIIIKVGTRSRQVAFFGTLAKVFNIPSARRRFKSGRKNFEEKVRTLYIPFIHFPNATVVMHRGCHSCLYNPFILASNFCSHKSSF